MAGSDRTRRTLCMTLLPLASGVQRAIASPSRCMSAGQEVLMDITLKQAESGTRWSHIRKPSRMSPIYISNEKCQSHTIKYGNRALSMKIEAS